MGQGREVLLCSAHLPPPVCLSRPVLPAYLLFYAARHAHPSFPKLALTYTPSFSSSTSVLPACLPSLIPSLSPCLPCFLKASVFVLLLFCHPFTICCCFLLPLQKLPKYMYNLTTLCILCTSPSHACHASALLLPLWLAFSLVLSFYNLLSPATTLCVCVYLCVLCIYIQKKKCLAQALAAPYTCLYYKQIVWKEGQRTDGEWGQGEKKAVCVGDGGVCIYHLYIYAVYSFPTLPWSFFFLCVCSLISLKDSEEEKLLLCAV